MIINIVCLQMPAPKVSKKRRKRDEMGCQGAFFPPTTTRSVAVSELTKASVVETHVSSLRPTTSSNGLPNYRLSTSHNLTISLDLQVIEAFIAHL